MTTLNTSATWKPVLSLIIQTNDRTSLWLHCEHILSVFIPRPAFNGALVFTALKQAHKDRWGHFIYKCLMNNKKMAVNIYTHCWWSASRWIIKNKPPLFLLDTVPESSYSWVGHKRSSKAINTIHRFWQTIHHASGLLASTALYDNKLL